MSPHRVMLVRHAEKPVDGESAGVDLAGRPDDHSLTPLGWQRAGALVRFFVPSGDPGASRVSTPDVVFAAGIGADHESGSKRPIQTAAPLAQALAAERAVPFVTTHLKHEVEPLVADVLQRSGCVLLVWEHKVMHLIVDRLTAGALGPAPWPQDCFDRVWILDRTDALWRFQEVGQGLLPGDSP